MRTIVSVFPCEKFHLRIKFDNGTEKDFDLNPVLVLPVFAPLRNPSVFNKVVNKVYFIQWENQEIDLSADTLWHDGKTIS